MKQGNYKITVTLDSVTQLIHYIVEGGGVSVQPWNGMGIGLKVEYIPPEGEKHVHTPSYESCTVMHDDERTCIKCSSCREWYR